MWRVDETLRGYMSSRRDSVLGEHREVIHAAAARNKADSIALVGSVARGDDTEESDYDFLAQFNEDASLFDQAGLRLDLKELLGCHVDVVLDPYAGSGTTLLAARELDRRWVGIELNPAFVDLIEHRLAL